MDINLPQVVISLDGNRGVLVTGRSGGFADRSGMDHHETELRVRLRPRAVETYVRFVVDRYVRALWNQPTQSLGWAEDFDRVLPDLVLVVFGEYLNDNPIPPQPELLTAVAEVDLTVALFDVFRREPEQEDARLLRYIGGKLVHSQRFGLGSVEFGRADAVRLGVSVVDLDSVAFQGLDELWTRGGVDQISRSSPAVRHG